MRILVATGRVPLDPPSYPDRLGAALAHALLAAGHNAEHVTVPFDPVIASGPAEALLLARLLELDRVSIGRVDRLIALDAPALAIRHERKVLWLAAFPAEEDDADDHDAPNARAAARAAVRLAARESRAVHAVSTALADRLGQLCGIGAAPLLPPPLADRPAPARPDGGGIPRPSLAAALAPHDDRGPHAPVLLLDRDAMHDEAARAAMAAGRPVLCCDDAGAPLDLVLDGVTGAVVPPDPAALRAARAAYADDPALARQHGEAGRRRLAALAPDWSGVLERLLD